jgi:hypothetical protein
MQAPAPLLQRLQNKTDMNGGRRLVVLLPQLGDFDSIEYAQALVPALQGLEAAGIKLLAIGIGDQAGADRFCSYTGLPPELLEVDAEPSLHRKLGLYEGLKTPGGPWPALLMMCAGIGSPGTLAEVFRGYRGDRRAPQLINNPLFRLAGGDGFQRPFELATVRLGNMKEVLSNWRTYVPRDNFITQRGGTFLLEADNSLLYSYRDAGILGYSATMNKPLSFLDPYLNQLTDSNEA